MFFSLVFKYENKIRIPWHGYRTILENLQMLFCLKPRLPFGPFIPNS